MAELQITQEYLGHSNHLVYLAPMWKEFLDADTYAKGRARSCRAVIDGSLEGKRDTGIAGVANTGRDATGPATISAQANWYAYGRLAWNPALDAGGDRRRVDPDDVGRTRPTVVATIRSIMLDSRETFVHYTMPLGLHHLIGGDHYAPMPENPDPRRADWSAIYYHRADAARHRLRSHATRQRRRRSVPLAAARAVERPDDDAGRAAAVVPPAAVGLPDEVGPHAVGRAGARLHARRGGSQGTRDALDGAARARSTRSATRPCSRSCAGRRATPPPGATSASATSPAARASAEVACRRRRG